jgi:hypothetical protein
MGGRYRSTFRLSTTLISTDDEGQGLLAPASSDSQFRRCFFNQGEHRFLFAAFCLPLLTALWKRAPPAERAVARREGVGRSMKVMLENEAEAGRLTSAKPCLKSSLTSERGSSGVALKPSHPNFF